MKKYKGFWQASKSSLRHVQRLLYDVALLGYLKQQRGSAVWLKTKTALEEWDKRRTVYSVYSNILLAELVLVFNWDLHWDFVKIRNTDIVCQENK
jgi:hypothetical protein